MQFLDPTLRDNRRIPLLQLGFGRELIDGLGIGALGFLNLAVGRKELGLGLFCCCIDLGNTPFRGFKRGLLLRTVELEDGLPRLDLVPHVYINLFDPADTFRQKRYRAKEGNRAFRRGMKIENCRDEKYRKYYTQGYSPTQLKKERIYIDFFADPFALHVPPKEIIRKDRKQRDEEKFKHG